MDGSTSDGSPGKDGLPGGSDSPYPPTRRLESPPPSAGSVCAARGVASLRAHRLLQASPALPARPARPVTPSRETRGRTVRVFAPPPSAPVASGGPEPCRCLAGARGDPGDVGDPGHDGTPGVPGKAGGPGSDGADGQDGKAGPPGPRGDIGEPGTDGFNGNPGYSPTPVAVPVLQCAASRVAVAMAVWHRAHYCEWYFRRDKPKGVPQQALLAERFVRYVDITIRRQNGGDNSMGAMLAPESISSPQDAQLPRLRLIPSHTAPTHARPPARPHAHSLQPDEFGWTALSRGPTRRARPTRAERHGRGRRRCGQGRPAGKGRQGWQGRPGRCGRCAASAWP
jgi:hypothetical protein